MCLDECTAFPATHEVAEKSMQLSHALGAALARRLRRARPATGCSASSRAASIPTCGRSRVEALTEIGFDGYAVGGLAVGEGQADDVRRAGRDDCRCCPRTAPRYLMGVGKPSDIVGAVRRGIDMFDCVMPTRSGRTGQAFTRRGVLNMRNARHADDDRPLDEECGCPACRSYSRAYLHHLFKAGEMLGPMLLTWHNLSYYQDLMADLRRAIAQGCFEERAAELEAQLLLGDIPAMPDPLAGTPAAERNPRPMERPMRRFTVSQSIYDGLTQLGGNAAQPAIAGGGGARARAEPASRHGLSGALHRAGIHLALPDHRPAGLRASGDRLRPAATGWSRASR